MNRPSIYLASRLSTVVMGSVLVMASACDPMMAPGEPASDKTESTGSSSDFNADSDSDSGTDIGDTVTPADDESTMPDPSACTDANNLERTWTVEDAGATRAGAVALGVDRVAWSTGSLDGMQLQMLDLDGGLQWTQHFAADTGWADVSDQSIAVGTTGQVAVAATLGDNALLYWYSSDGVLSATHVHDTDDSNRWQSVTFLPGGDVVAVGNDNKRLVAMRYAPGAKPVWTQAFDAPGDVWGTDVVRMSTGRLVVSAHSNVVGPVLAAFDADGNEQWMHFDEGAGPAISVALDIAVDATDRVWTAINMSNVRSLLGRVERFDAAGNREHTTPLDFYPTAIAVAPDGRVVLAGRDFNLGAVVVESRTPEGSTLHRYERFGFWPTGLVVDDACHTYVVGENQSEGTWLEKLQ